jgi:hypothetical protein
MPNFLKKLIFPLIVVAVVLHLSIMGLQAFLSWQGNNKENNSQEKDYRTKKKEDLEIEKLERDLEGFRGNYTLYE